MVNGHDIAHGGLVFTLADTAFACACNSWGPVTVAAGGEIVFVAAGAARRRARGPGAGAHPLRPQRHLRRHRAARRRGGRRVPRPQRRAAPMTTPVTGTPRARAAGPGSISRPCSRAASRCSTSAASTARAWRTSPGTSASRKSAIYHHVSSKDALLRLALDRALDGLIAVADARPGALDAPAVDRLEFLVRRQRRGAAVEQLPYVTLLLRVRGNTEVERHGAGAPPAASTASPPGWCAQARRGGRPAPRRRRRRSPPACCSAWSTRSSSGTGRRGA